MLDKKQIQVIFLFEFKMGQKAAETTCHINNTFGPGTANKHTGHWWFKNFCKGNESLEDEECSGQPLEVDNNQLRAIIKKPILLQLHEKLLKSSTLTILWSFGIWSKLERWKSLISGCLRSWLTIKKNHLFEMSSSLTTTNHFSIRLWLVVKSDDQLSGWTNKKLQSTSQIQTCTQERWWSLFGELLPVWSLQLSESWQNHYIWEICSASRWDALKTHKGRTRLSNWTELHRKLQCLQLVLVNRMGQILLHNNTWPHVAQLALGYEDFASFAILTWPLANRLPLLETSWQLFAGEMLLQPAGGRKCFPRACWIPKHGFLCYRNKQTYFSLAKICWL